MLAGGLLALSEFKVSSIGYPRAERNEGMFFARMKSKRVLHEIVRFLRFDYVP
jgi:hypothetical protein